MGGMSYEGYQDHRQINAALLHQQLQQQHQQQQQQQPGLSTQATLQMAAMQIQQQQYSNLQQQPHQLQLLQQLEDPQQQQQQQQHLLSYAQTLSMTQTAMPIPVGLGPQQQQQQQVQQRPAAGTSTMINGLPYQLQMNSDGTQVWVPLVPHTMSYSIPPSLITNSGMAYLPNMGQSDQAQVSSSIPTGMQQQ